MALSYDELSACRACPRLAAHLATVREAHPDYHCQPVGAWGSPRARLLIVGLAPGLHGANRCGQPFTGDASGAFLFAALSRSGFASDPDPARARLRNVRITNAVKCLPPGNRPLAADRSSNRDTKLHCVTMTGARRRPRRAAGRLDRCATS